MDLKVSVWNGNDEDAVPGEIFVSTGPDFANYAVDLAELGSPNPVTDIFIQSLADSPIAPWTLKKMHLQKHDGGGRHDIVASNKRSLEQLLQIAVDWANTNSMPLHVGEFGAYELADMASRVRWTKTVRRLLDNMGVDWAYWELGAGFGFYRPESDDFRLSLTRALMPDFQEA